MSDEDQEFETIREYDSYEEVRYEVQQKRDTSWEYRYKIVDLNRGETHYRSGYHQAKALITVIRSSDIDLNQNDDTVMIPVDIALMKKPQITTYLCGVLEHDPSTVGDMMGVSRETIVKYLNRASERRYSE